MRKLRKKDLAVLCSLVAVVLLLGGVAFYVARLYQGTGLFVVDQFEGAFSFNGKLLIAPDESAKSFDSLGASGYQDLSLEKIDLTPFGFEGKEYSYYRYSYRVNNGDVNKKKETLLVAAEEGYEGFWPVSRPDKFVYLAEDGKKYRIHPNENLCYPMFSDSIDGVDVYGTNVVAFSSNASYAVGIEGEKVIVYHTDPMDDSLRIVDVKEVSLDSYGVRFRFGAFVGDSAAYFEVENEKGNVSLIALDCRSGQLAKSHLNPEETYGAVLNRLFVQSLDPEENKEGERRAVWCHRLLGTRFSVSIPEEFTVPELFSVSPQGNYALGTSLGPQGEEILVMSQKRLFSLSSLLQEGETVDEVFFVHENVLAVNLTASDGKKICRSYKICF